MGNITKVDFVNKKVRHFQEEQKIARDDVREAIDTLKEFIAQDFNTKISDTNSAEQIILHEIEDAEEQVLRENAEDILLNLRDIRNSRREAKECQDMKKTIERLLTKTSICNAHQALVVSPKKEGSSKKYFDGKVKRSSASKEYLEKALIENIIGGK